tara:strand:+ start:2452 stop:3987 length:1536 start_codon:yes stop_codon:yes gene_type:complete
MFYKRPSFRMGGTPTGIDSLTPRVQAQEGFLGNRDMFLLPSNLKNLQNQRFDVGTSGGVITSNAQKMRSFPMDASEMGVASVAEVKPTDSSAIGGTKFQKKEPLEFNTTDEFLIIEQPTRTGGTRKVRVKNPNYIPTGEFRDIKGGKGKIFVEDKKENVSSGATAEGGTKFKKSKIDMDAISDDILKKAKGERDFKQRVLEGEREFLERKEPKIIIDDTLEGENLEDSFESEFEKQYKRLQKYLGADKDEQKGRLALALSDAVGTPGTLADKAAVLNKALLGIATQKKKDKKEIAKLAFAAATDLEGKRISAGKKTSAQQLIDRYVALKGKDKRTKEEELELKALEADLKITKDDTLNISGALNYSTALDTLKKNLEQIFDKNTTDETEKRILRNRIKSIIAGLRKAGIADATIQKDLADYPGASEFFSQGGRVNMANGGATDAPAAPVDTKLNFEQLRTRLPQEITDDIIRLIANNEEALQDFSFIRTQGDVSKFNVKYGVNLVLPQDTV